MHKSSCDLMLPLHSKLFNLILDTGVVPESWLIGQNTDFKNDRRGITLLVALNNF